jgi:branched-chain amino acid transport system permease protein
VLAVRSSHKSSATKRIILAIAVGAILFVASNFIDEYRIFQGAQVAAYLVGIISIVLLTGYSGQITLGQGAFMAVGAYSASLVVQEFGLPMWASFFVAVIAAALFGAIIGISAGRLSGPYLAGATLAFAVGIPALANAIPILGGEQGLSFDIGYAPGKYADTVSPYKWLFWICALCAIVAIVIAVNLTSSGIGRQWRAVRAHETAAALSGINPARSKVLAFTVSSGFAGLAGVSFSATVGLVAPSSFTLGLSFLLLTGSILGGISHISGALGGALIIVIIPTIFESWTEEASLGVATYLPGIIVSVLLLLSIALAPEGPSELLHKIRHRHRH